MPKPPSSAFFIETCAGAAEWLLSYPYSHMRNIVETALGGKLEIGAAT